MNNEIYHDMFIYECEPTDSATIEDYYKTDEDYSISLKEFTEGYQKYYDEQSRIQDKMYDCANELAGEVHQKINEKAKELGIDPYDLDAAFTELFGNLMY